MFSNLVLSKTQTNSSVSQTDEVLKGQMHSSHLNPIQFIHLNFFLIQVAQRTFRNTMDNSLTISGTISLDTGEYICVADNGLDSDSASAMLIIQGNLTH